jgi:hypothetical protein
MRWEVIVRFVDVGGNVFFFHKSQKLYIIDKAVASRKVIQTLALFSLSRVIPFGPVHALGLGHLVSHMSLEINRNYSAILTTLQITSYALGV